MTGRVSKKDMLRVENLLTAFDDSVAGIVYALAPLPSLVELAQKERPVFFLARY